MVEIPKALAQSIRRGDCVLWTGAGLGTLADRPAWKQLLGAAAEALAEDDRKGVQALIDKGRLRPVLEHLRRTQGDSLRKTMLASTPASNEDRPELPDPLAKLGQLPWAGVFATVHPDLAHTVAARGQGSPELLSPDELDGRVLGNGTGRFVLHTPAELPSWVGHPDLRDVLQQAASGHTILLLGFSAEDPDLEMVLESLADMRGGTQHYALVSGLTAPERDALAARYGLQVLDPGDALPDAIGALVDASDADGEADAAELHDRARNGMDLALVVSDASLRADVASIAAERIDGRRVAGYVDALGGKGLAGLGAGTLLRAGGVLLAHASNDRARRCFSAATAAAATDVDRALGQFGTAWVDFAEGNVEGAVEGLTRAGALHSAAALAPAGYTIETIIGRFGARSVVVATGPDDVRAELEITTLTRAPAAAERQDFSDATSKLASIREGAASGIRSGKAQGRRLIIERELLTGPTLADGLAAGVLGLEDAARLVGVLAEALTEIHSRGLAHGALTAADVVLTDDGPKMRGLGRAAVVRTSLRSPTAKGDALALAALAFEAMTGVQPVNGASAAALIPDLDPRVDAVLAAAMHPLEDQRSDVAELHAALDAIATTPDQRPSEEIRPGRATEPDDPDDLEGWVALLAAKPTNAHGRAALERIEHAARSAEQWDRVADVLSARIGQTQVVAERVTLLRELASLYEAELGVPVSAFETTRTLLDAVDGEEQVALVPDLERLARATGCWAPLAEALDVIAARTSDPRVQVSLHTRVGELHAERLGAIASAIEAYGKAAELAPSAQTLAPLVPLYRKAMRMAELATTLLSLAEYQQGADKVESLTAAADLLQTDLGETEGAFATLQAVLELDPTHAGALEQAEELARQLEDWDALVDLLAARAEAPVDNEQRASMLREAAEICTEQLEQPDRAATFLAKLVEADRGDRDAAEQLVRVLRSRVADDLSQRASLIDALGVLIGLADDGQSTAALLEEQAVLLDAESDGAERAVDARERILATVGLGDPKAQAAAATLEKAYRRTGNDGQLVALLERVGAATDADTGDRVEAWTKLLAHSNAGASEDTDRAIAVLEKLAELQPDSNEWRDQLLDLYLERDDFKKAGPLIRERVTDEEDPKRKAELLLRGGLLRAQIGKTEGAIEALEQAVAIDDTLHEAWAALQSLYTAEDQPLKAIEAQVKAARANPNRNERVRLTFEAATRFVDDLGQEERGLALLEELVEFDPDHREATGMLVERLVATGDLERAWPPAQTFVMQVRSQAPHDKPLNVKALSTAGRCALAVGETERARDYLEKARIFDATNLNVLRLLADLSMDAGAYTDALRHYQSVVLGVGSKMSPPDLSRLYVHMADARRGMEEPAKAVQMAERALEIDPDNDSAIERLTELAAVHGGAAALVNAKRRHADRLKRRHQVEGDDTTRAAIAEQRVAVLRELAKLQADDLKAPVEAVGTLEELLEIRPDDPGVLHDLLGIFTKSERWRDAKNVIERLAEAQRQASHRAKYLWAGALIFRDQLGELDPAMTWIKQVLEADPMHDKAYEAGIEILKNCRNFKELARHLRGRLKALPKDAPAQTRVELFAELGQIYEEHLSDPKTAIAAYSQSVRFASGALAGTDEIRERRVKIMKIAVQLGDDEIDKAILQGHALISEDPMEFEVYHRLVELYLRRGDRDRARSLSRALVFLKQADEAEQEIANSTGGSGGMARRKISRELWRQAVMHRQQNPRISDIFTVVWPMVAAREGRTLSKYGLARTDKLAVGVQSLDPVARFVAHACQVFDVAQPEFFHHDDPGGLVVDALVDTEGEQQRVFPSLLAGKSAQADKGEGALKFMVGRAAARVRPEHILGAILKDAGSLRNTLWGVVALSLPDTEVPTDVVSESAKLAEVFRTYLSPSKIEQLGKVVGKVLEGGDFDTKLWLQSAAYTVTRAGFVLCDDLATAARSLTTEGDAGLAVPVKDRVRDLVGYSVSDPYLKLRREIGFAG